MKQNSLLTGKERFFPESEIIVSKTNLKGHITYANKLFLDIAGYSEKEVIGKPHNLIRHPNMPRVVFKTLWDTLCSGHEIFAYVINRCKNGDHYWVYAHVTPTKNDKGEVISYHSNRRVPQRDVLETQIIPLYRKLKTAEDNLANRREGLMASQKLMQGVLAENSMKYDEFVMTLGQGNRRGYR